MKFKDVIGHEDIKDRLRHMADTDRVPHALLFGGPAGVGKMKIARAFAQYLQCTDRHNGDSCGRCPSCLQHAQFANPDMNFVFPVLKKGSKSRVLSADWMDEWKQFLTEEPYMKRERWLELLDAGNGQPVIYVNEAAEIARTAIMSNYASKQKIYLIWLPESMNVETANKLLKLIEEPWENTIFLMVSNEPSQLLPTIFSRTQRLNFRPLSENNIAEYLISKGISADSAARIARHSEGSALRADELALDKGESAEFGKMYRAMMRATYGRNIAELYELSEHLSGCGREHSSRFLDYCSHMARENFMYNLRMPQIVSLSPDEEEFSRRFSPFVNHRNVENLVAETERARHEIMRNANSRVVLFDMMLQIARYIRVK